MQLARPLFNRRQYLGFVNTDPAFRPHHKVLDNCSDLMFAVFEDRRVRARSVIGASSLRSDLLPIVDSVFEISSS